MVVVEGDPLDNIDILLEIDEVYKGVVPVIQRG